MPANTLETSTQDAGAAKRLDAFGELVLLAPVSGVLYPLERVPDPVFSQKLAGDGISIDPTAIYWTEEDTGSVWRLAR